jgi:hypothetical protein
VRTLILLNIICFLTLTSFGQTVKPDEQVKKDLLRVEQQNDSLKLKLNSILKSQAVLEKRLQDEQNRQDGLTNSVDILNQNNIHSSTLSKIGALILLLGLFIEVIGATLLAGADLSNKIELIRSVRLEYTLGDLAIEDKMKDNVMTFYGILGSILLVIGFCFQFTGTIIILGLPWFVLILFIAIAIIASFAVLTFLAGQNVNQPLSEKARIFFRNLKRVIIFPIRQRFVGRRTIVCEICQKSMLCSKAEVWYKQETQSEQYPYLYPPYGFYLGHADCLKEIYPDKEKQHFSMMPPHPLYKKAALDFYANHLDKLYTWNEERLKDLQRKRHSDKKIIDETEVSLRNLKTLLTDKQE